MSIINNVLKDLESRPHRFTPIEVAAVGRSIVDHSRSKTIMLVLLPGLIILTIAFSYFQVAYQAEKQPIAEIPVAEQVHRGISQTANAVVIEPPSNQITGMQIRESESEISFEFSMRDKAVSYLKERSENSFIYHLKNIDSEIEAPRINNNRWIENLDILTVAQGIDVVLTTVPGVLVNTAQLENQNEVLWTIRLEKLPDPVVVARLPVVDESPEIPTVVTDTRPAQAVDNAPKVALQARQNTQSEPVKVEIKSTGPSLDVSARLNKAIQSMHAGQWQQAEELLQSLLGGTLDITARKHLLAVYSSSGKDDQFFSFARQSQLRYPQQAVFRTQYARSLFNKQQYSELIRLLQNAGELDSPQYALLAASYQRMDQHQKAVEHYHHALKLDKRQARNWIGLGISLEHEARLEKAFQSYQTALRLGNLNEKLIEFVEQRSKMLKKVIN